MQKFFVGDIVKYVGKTGYFKGTQLIKEACYRGGGKFEYATTTGAWMEDKDFVLVKKANLAAFKVLDKDLYDEDYND